LAWSFYNYSPLLAFLFEILRGSAKNSKIRNGFVMVWQATLWSIWKVRNNAIFSAGIFVPQAIVDDVKVLSWKWSLGRLKILPCLFYEWTWDPRNFFCASLELPSCPPLAWVCFAAWSLGCCCCPC
jgi:hypothetical protein